MSFVAIANPPPATAEALLSNDGWFPDLLPGAVRAACRLDGTVTTERFLLALKDAMLSVNAELADWAAEQRERHGYLSLEQVPAPRIGGESARLLQYRRAVHACLQADLLDTYRGMAAVATGNKLERSHEDLQLHADDYRRQQRWAISDLTARPRSTIELL